MASLNKVFIMGNLTRDPELRYVPSGTAVATFTIAVNRVYTSQAGEKKEEVSFIRVVVWGRRAEVCGEYLSKGSPVFVEGRLHSRSWEGQDGQKRNTIEVIADNVQFLRGSSGGEKSAGSMPKPAEQSAPDVATINLNDELGPIPDNSANTKSDKSGARKPDQNAAPKGRPRIRRVVGDRTKRGFVFVLRGIVEVFDDVAWRPRGHKWNDKKCLYKKRAHK